MVTSPVFRVNGAVLDSAHILRPVTITHGRSGIGTQPDAPVLNFTTETATPPAAVGDTVTVDTGVPSLFLWDDPGVPWDSPDVSWDSRTRPVDRAPSARFAGVVNDLRAVNTGGAVREWSVTAVGGLASLGRVPVTLDRAEETDTVRVEAIAAAAGVTIRVVGAPSVTLAPDTLDRDALSALHQICETSAGLVWQSPDGALNYGTSSHRGGDATAVFGACAFLDGLTWEQTANDIVNEVTVTWGTENAQQQNTLRDDVSVALFGVRHADARTLAADEAAAVTLGFLILARRAHPWWRTPDLMVSDDGDLSEVDLLALHNLDVGSIILVPAPAEPGPTPITQPTRVLVEGWVETWDDGGHWFQLAVTDHARWVETQLRTWAESAQEPWSYWVAGSWLQQLAGGLNE